MQSEFYKIYRKFYNYLSGRGLRKYSTLKSFNNFIASKINFATVYGHEMYFPEHYRNLLTTGLYDPFETSFYENQIKNGDIVIDIGANIGIFTLLFAKLVGSNGHVYAFEADPTNFEILKKNIEINSYQNTTLENKAIFHKNEKINLFLSPSNPGDHRIYDSNDGRKSIQINSIILDDYILQKKVDVDFVKIDVQGSELSVIQGMKKLLEPNNIKIMMEFEPILLEKFGTKPLDLLDILESYGFHFFDINEIEQKIKHISISELISKYNTKNGNRTNLFLEK